MYAIIQTGGKQYQVSKDQELEVEKLSTTKKKVEFPEVLLVKDGKKLTLGQPFVKNCKVEAQILGQIKGKKIRVATYKAKSRYRRVKGHRQHLTRVKILRIVTREKTK